MLLSGNGISLMTANGPAVILTLYGNFARLRTPNATSRDRLLHSRLFEHVQDPQLQNQGELRLRDDIKDVCDGSDGIIYAVDGGLDPIDGMHKTYDINSCIILQ
jgi:hypothetical protein